MTAPINWANVVLCTDADVASFESTWLDWSQHPVDWRKKAKEVIEVRLRHALRDRELATEEVDVLNLIGNPSVLKHAACFKAIELCALNNVLSDGDAWTFKAKAYEKRFNEEFQVALEMLSFDTDESGTIEDAEKYTVTSGVTFSRGAGVPPTYTGEPE